MGAWVALQVLTGEVAAERLVAEGQDDLTCEGSAQLQIQVKSRQQRVGDFRVREVAVFVLQAWKRRSERLPAGLTDVIVVVLERGVEGVELQDWTQRLLGNPACAALVEVIRQQAQMANIARGDVDVLLAQTCVIVAEQQRIYAEAASIVTSRTGLLLGATLPVVQALRAAIAEHADRNAEVGWSERVGLSRTDIERTVVDAAALVDRQSLLEATSNGSCEVIDFDTPLPDPTFYSGTATHPGHVAAGLVTARPEPTDEVLIALGRGEAVLVAGPSGIGKSAVMWMAAYVARHVVWYRVHRLREDDVEPLIRLAVAAGAGRYGPVGFVVDGVGVGSLTAWDALQRRADGVAGVLLLGSVREEDTLPLETFGQCVVVRPRLDEQLAARIHEALLDGGVTTQPHWREAYEQSAGLTLEFTHVLSRGRRLRDVLNDQVRLRVQQKRTVELAVLAPVTVAHRWGGSLAVAALEGVIAAPAGELKAALTCLADEHLLTIDDGIVSGLHPLRSAALCDAIHDVPPPTLGGTVHDVVQRLDAPVLAAFVARCLADTPSVTSRVVDCLRDRLVASPSDLRATAAALAGLRLADFTATARSWVATLDKHEVPIPMRPLALDLGMIDSDLIELFDPRLIAAVEEIRSYRVGSTSPLRDQLVAHLGLASISERIHTATDADSLTALLDSLADTGLTVDPVPPEAPVRPALQETPLLKFAELIATARCVSLQFAQVLVDAAGGRETVLGRLRDEHPWLINLEVVINGTKTVLRGRVLHVSDRHNPEPERSIKELAMLGLRCLPDVDQADLTTVLADGVPLSFNGHAPAVSRLLRQYAPSAHTVAWNRQRSRFARSLVTTTSTSEKLDASLHVLQGAADFLADFVEAWITDRGVGQRLDNLNRKRAALLPQIEALAPAPVSQPIGAPDDEQSAMVDNDPVHGVAQAVVRDLPARMKDPSGYASLAAFLGDTVGKQLREVEGQPWALLGHDRPPDVLARLAELTAQLSAVLAERALGDTHAAQILAVTRAMPRGKALARAVSLVDGRARWRYEQAARALVAKAQASGFRVEVKSQPHPDPTAVLWPPIRTAVVAHVEAGQLAPAISAVANALSSIGLPGQAVLFIPVREGVAIPQYAMRLFASSGNVYPAAEEARTWLDLIPPTQPMPCTNAVAEGIEALRELSALAWLDTQRPTAPHVQEAVDAAIDRFHDVIARLEALPSDDVRVGLSQELATLADRVQSQAEDGMTQGPFAEAFARGLAEGSEEFMQTAMLVYLATEWDISPDGAAALLA